MRHPHITEYIFEFYLARIHGIPTITAMTRPPLPSHARPLRLNRIARKAVLTVITIFACSTVVGCQAEGSLSHLLASTPGLAPSTLKSLSPASEPTPEISERSETTPGSQAAQTAATPAIADILATLPIKGRAPLTGYNRKNFGQRWSDDVAVEFGHNGCDTRNDILNRDLINKEYKPNTRDCVVLHGILNDPYTGQTINFQRGAGSSEKVQIDHVVSLADAWQKGAQLLDDEQRQNFANDPLNLLAVDGTSNQKKGSGDTATWLPPNNTFRCQYVGRQILVKSKYQLWVTPAEAEAMQQWVQPCSFEDLAALEELARQLLASSPNEFNFQAHTRYRSLLSFVVVS